jgi:hypothetical protein
MTHLTIWRRPGKRVASAHDVSMASMTRMTRGQADEQWPIALVAVAPSAKGAAIAKEVWRRKLAPLTTSETATAIELSARSKPAVAIVSARLPCVARLLERLRVQAIPGVIIGNHGELRSLEPLLTEIGLIDTVDPSEVAIAAAVLAR